MLPIDQLMSEDQTFRASPDQAAAHHHSIPGLGGSPPANLLGHCDQLGGIDFDLCQRPAQGFVTPVDIGRVIRMPQGVHPAVPELDLKVGKGQGIHALPGLQPGDRARRKMRQEGGDQPIGGAYRSQPILPLPHMHPGLGRFTDQALGVQKLALPARKKPTSEVSHPAAGLDCFIRAKLPVMPHGHGPHDEARSGLSIARGRPARSNRSLDRDLLEESPDLPRTGHLPRTDSMPWKGKSDTGDGICIVHGGTAWRVG